MKTKRIKMLSGETGKWPGWKASYHCRAGEEHDVPVKLADAWIAKSIAEAVKPVTKTPSKPKSEPAATSTTTDKE